MTISRANRTEKLKFQPNLNDQCYDHEGKYVKFKIAPINLKSINPTSKKKITHKDLILLLSSITVSLVLFEGLLRLIFSSDQSYLIEASQDGPYITSNNKYWKVWHYPYANSQHQKNCFDATYTTNSLGMRDGDTTEHASFRIALLGDSFVEGLGNSDHEIFSHILDSLMGKEIEILNFGTSGGFGTVHELSLYENFVRHFKPDLVMLFYLNYNDPYDNIKAIREGLVTQQLKFTYPTGTLKEVLTHISKDPPSTTKVSKIVQGFYTLNLVNKGLDNIEEISQIMFNMKFDFKRSLAEVYDSTATNKLQIGYEIAKKSLERLSFLVREDSSELVVVNLPDPYQIDKNWMRANEIKYGIKLDPHHPNRLIGNICEEKNILYHDMLPETMSYLDQHNVEFPFFSFTCDRHPSKFGHQYLANYLYEYLLEHHLNKLHASNKNFR